MQLLYVWIEEYKNIKKQGFNFSSELRFDYNYETGELKIEENPNHTTNFFPKGISNVTAIVGGNGSGKSSLLEFLTKFYDYKSLVAYKADSNVLYISYEKQLGVQVLNKTNYQIDKKTVFNNNSARYEPVDGFNSSKDIIFYSPIHSLTSTEEFQSLSFDYRLAKLLKNGYEKYSYRSTERQINLLGDNRLRNYLPFDKFPDSVTILPKKVDFGFRFLREETRELENFARTQLADLRQNERLTKYWLHTILWNIFFQLLYQYSRLNLKPDFVLDEKFSVEDYLSVAIKTIIETEKKQPNDGNVSHEIYAAKLNAFTSFILANKDEFSAVYLPYSGAIGVVVSLCDEKGNFSINKFNSFINNFFSLYQGILYIGQRDHPNYLLFEWTGLSSGEHILLNQFSIFYSIKQENISSSYLLILIDEGETGLHPEWQKRYIRDLLNFISHIYPDKNIQIIITSHSPFIASDLPNSNIVFLEKDKQTGRTIVKNGLNDMKQTFGANIHTLLTDSFFMRDGLMGSFAKEKIDTVIAYLNGETVEGMTDELAQKYISIIGEPIIRNQLQKMLDSKRLSKADEIDNIKNQITQLHKRLEKLEGDATHPA